jgi:exosortase/archaeosortase family protein
MTRGRPAPLFGLLLALACGLLLVMPFITTFDDLLTTIGLRLGIGAPLQAIVPTEVRAVVASLNLVGIHAGAAANQLVVWNAADVPQTLFISWNCVGWQSLILLGLSLMVGLRGTASWQSRTQVIAIGLLGTMLVNILRITTVCLIAALAGYVPAILFHDYGGTVLLIAWLFGFWLLAYGWLMVEPAHALEAAR